jgi:hypothetical protein
MADLVESSEKNLLWAAVKTRLQPQCPVLVSWSAPKPVRWGPANSNAFDLACPSVEWLAWGWGLGGGCRHAQSDRY